MIKAINPAMADIIIDSIRNCAINDFFNAPATFRIPTSFARFSLLAVDRFMKLIQAINNIKTAMSVNNLTVSIRPPVGFPSTNFEYNLNWLTGYKKDSSLDRPPEYLITIFFILEFISASLVLGLSSTNVLMETSVQSASM